MSVGIAFSAAAALNWSMVGTASYMKPTTRMTESRIVADSAVPGETSTAETPDSMKTGLAAGRTSGALSKSDISQLIAKEYVGLRLLIARRAGDHQVAADMLNDALCMAWEKWCAGQIQRPEQIAGYVFQVAINLLHNHRRSVADRPDRRADVEHIDQFHVTADATDQQIEEGIAARVRHFIHGMSSLRDRTVLVRFYLNEEEKDSICADMGVSPLQFDKILHRARRRLRQLLESQGITRSELLSLLCFL
jgi:RNA polymerase sigma-70 factor (ECF subfamily)